MVNTPTSYSNDSWNKCMAIGIGVTWLITFGGSGSRTRFFFHGSTALVGHGLLIAEVSRPYSDTHITLGRTPLDE